METNIPEILKDKPVNLKLYSPTYGNCTLIVPEDMIITDTFGINRCFDVDGKISKAGECMLFPSKEMRDWSKFAWKKGDVLVSNDGGEEVIFDKWYDDTYTSFYGNHYLNSENENNIKYDKYVLCIIDKYSLEDKDASQCYINTIEERLGGKLNRETLKIEKTQPEFKNGDIAYADYGNKQAVFIVSGKTDLSEGYNSFIALDLRGTLDMGRRMSFFKEDLCKLRLATEEEKQQLFDALAKEGKAWDAEKKEIIDLKPKVEFKPFDRVLVRDCLDEMWRPSFFAFYLPFGREPYQIIGGEWVKLCIPYEGNESLLGTTKDVEG